MISEESSVKLEDIADAFTANVNVNAMEKIPIAASNVVFSLKLNV